MKQKNKDSQMPRPLRIEYENAIYHVMNRGRARQSIFHCDEYYHTFFVETLGDACYRFGSLVHSYCLLGNHCHLLIENTIAHMFNHGSYSSVSGITHEIRTRKQHVSNLAGQIQSIIKNLL